MREQTGGTELTKVLTWGALAAGALAGGYFVLKHLLRSDEPPIRVRGGSIHVDLQGPWRWRYDGPDDSWWIPSTQRRNPHYRIQLSTTTPPSACAGLTHEQVSIVRFVHSTGDWVKLDATGRKTRVTSNRGLLLSGDEKTLVLCVAGHVATIEVTVGGATTQACTFSMGQFTEAHAIDP